MKKGTAKTVTSAADKGAMKTKATNKKAETPNVAHAKDKHGKK